MSMSIKDFFDISLKSPVCIEGLSEDAVRQFVDAIEVTVKDPTFSGFVLSVGNAQVKFNFGPDGNFAGAVTRLNGKNIPLINGVNSKELYVFQGPPSATNPGSGWELSPDLTRKYLSQSGPESGWEIFFASRAAVINDILTT